MNFYKGYTDPEYWNGRTPLWIGMPRLLHLYQDLNDNKIRIFLWKMNGKILDLGCGDGRFLNYATVGVDFSRGMLERVKYKQRTLIRGSVTDLPFRDKCFDVAFMVDVLIHIEPNHRLNAKEEARRVSKKSFFFRADRWWFPKLYYLLIKLGLKPRRAIPYLAFFLSFLFDRFQTALAYAKKRR